MVAILLSTARVAADSLQMACRVRTDPHVRPGRRDDQGANSAEHFAIPNDHPVLVEVGEPFPDAAPAQADSLRRRIVQAGQFSRLIRIFCNESNGAAHSGLGLNCSLFVRCNTSRRASPSKFDRMA